MIAIRLLVVVACLCAFAPSNIEAKKKVKRVEDVFCDGKGKFEVYLKKGKDYLFETAMKPKKNTKCVVHYKLENGCSNVVIDQVQYSLNDEKSCYKRIKGSNKKGKGEAQVDFCGAPSGEGWEHDATTIGTDPNDVHMHTEFGDSTSWPLAIDEDFTIIFTQKVASGSHMKHRIRCTEGMKEPELNQGCRCGMKKSETTLPTASWMVKNFGTLEYGGEKHDDFEFPAVLVADKWIITADEIDSFEPKNPSELEILGRDTTGEMWQTSTDSENKEKIGKLTTIKIFDLLNTVGDTLLNLNDNSPVCLPTSAVLETAKIKNLLTYGHQYDTDAEDFEEDPVDVKLKVLKRETCDKILAKNNREKLGVDEECVVPLKKKGNTVCEPDLGAPIFHTQLGKDLENFVIYGFVIEFGQASYCASKKHPARIQKISQDTLDFINDQAQDNGAFTCSPYAPKNNCKASNGTEFFCAAKDENGEDQECCGDVCGPKCNPLSSRCENGKCECHPVCDVTQECSKNGECECLFKGGEDANGDKICCMENFEFNDNDKECVCGHKSGEDANGDKICCKEKYEFDDTDKLCKCPQKCSDSDVCCLISEMCVYNTDGTAGCMT